MGYHLGNSSNTKGRLELCLLLQGRRPAPTDTWIRYIIRRVYEYRNISHFDDKRMLLRTGLRADISIINNDGAENNTVNRTVSGFQTLESEEQGKGAGLANQEISADVAGDNPNCDLCDLVILSKRNISNRHRSEGRH